MAGSAVGLVSDGCTLWFEGDWGDCCRDHDLAYSTGVPKTEADLSLALCVAQTGHGGMALLMLAGVLLFGWIFYPRKKRK